MIHYNLGLLYSFTDNLNSDEVDVLGDKLMRQSFFSALDPAIQSISNVVHQKEKKVEFFLELKYDKPSRNGKRPCLLCKYWCGPNEKYCSSHLKVTSLQNQKELEARQEKEMNDKFIQDSKLYTSLMNRKLEAYIPKSTNVKLFLIDDENDTITEPIIQLTLVSHQIRPFTTQPFESINESKVKVSYS